MKLFGINWSLGPLKIMFFLNWVLMTTFGPMAFNENTPWWVWLAWVVSLIVLFAGGEDLANKFLLDQADRPQPTVESPPN